MPRFEFSFITREEILTSPGGREMIQAIDHPSSEKIFILTGCPGSGKTTISIHRAAYLETQKKNFIMLTYGKLLKHSIKKIAEKANLAEGRIDTLMTWYYSKFRVLMLTNDRPVDIDIKSSFSNSHFATEKLDEIIIDEGQDLWPELYRNFHLITKNLTIGSDDAQSVYDGRMSTEQILLEISRNGDDPRRFTLTANFRNPRRIYDFSKKFLPNALRLNISQFTKGDGDLPFIYFFKNNEEMIVRLSTIISNNEGVNIGILCEEKYQVDYVFSSISKNSKNISRYHSTLPIEDIDNVLITTFKSAKGLEFEVVILPFVERYSERWDSNRRSYYVGCTRAKQKLFLLCSSPQLPPVFNGFESNLYRKIG